MKKKLMLILSLFFLIIPLAGCGEQESGADMVNVSTTLTKQTAPGALINFVVRDCASISGAGNYKKGENATIIVKYVDKACAVDGIKKDGGAIIPITSLRIETVENTNGIIKQIKYILNGLSEDTNVEVIVSGKADASKKNKIEFLGVFEEDSSDNSLKKVEGTKFPVKNESDLKMVSKSTYSLDQKVKLASLLADPNKELNLKYLHINDDLKLVNLEWQVGRIVMDPVSLGETCSFAEAYKTIIGDPNSEEISTGENLCLRAVIKDENVENDFIKNAIGAMVAKDISMWVSTSETECVNISSECGYVSNLSGLYNSNLNSDSTESDKEEAASLYLGYTEDGKVELVNTDTSSFDKYYYICAVGSPTTGGYSCVKNGDNDPVVNKILYPFDSSDEDSYDDGYELIGGLMKNFINDVIGIEAESSDYTIELKYNGTKDDLLPVYIKKNGSENTYHISYSGYNISHPDAFKEKINSSEDKQYTISLGNIGASDLENELNNNIINTIFTSSDAVNLSKELSEKIAKAIDSNPSSYGQFKNYIFEMNTDGEITSEKYNYLEFVEKLQKFNFIIYKEKEDEVSISKAYAYKYTGDVNTDYGIDKINVLLNDIASVNGFNNDNYRNVILTDTIYEFEYAGNEVTIDISTDGVIKIQYGKEYYELIKKDPQENGFNYDTLTSTIKGDWANFTQELTSNTGTVISKVGETEITGADTVSTDSITTFHNLLSTSGNIYQLADDYLVLVDNKGNVYKIEKDEEDENEYKFTSGNTVYEFVVNEQSEPAE